MSKKLLTDDLILAKMAEDHGCLAPEDVDFDAKLQAIKEHYEFSISEEWNNPDFMFYTETTADGYEIWIATDNDRNPSVNEDIYYYDNDHLEKMPNCMYDGCSIYYSDLNSDCYDFQDVVDEVYEEYFGDIKLDVENELIEEGYEREED
tara:strand:- start:1955 stop:2401 length:447 start_codon:yes stop_codon:yes gene_type:complete